MFRVGCADGANLVAPPGDRGDHVSTGWVPFDVRGHVVLCYVHHDAVGGVHEGKSSVHTEHTKTRVISSCGAHHS